MDNEWGIRLADVRVPSWYRLNALALVLAALVGVGEFRNRSAWGQATMSARGAH
jgi:hypothetical protein